MSGTDEKMEMMGWRVSQPFAVAAAHLGSVLSCKDSVMVVALDAHEMTLQVLIGVSFLIFSTSLFAAVFRDENVDPS